MRVIALFVFLFSTSAFSNCDYKAKGVAVDPPAPPADTRMDSEWTTSYYEVFDVLCKNLKTPNRFFRGYRAHPGPPYKAAYVWDTAFISQIWMQWDPAIAQELIKYLLRFQAKDGLIHHAVLELLIKPWPYSGTQPPLLAWATWRMYEKTQDRVFLNQVYGGLKKYHEWLVANRRHPDGLFFWHHPYESGIDNSPRFSNQSESVVEDTRQMAAVDMTSYMATSMESLAKMADVLGYTQDKEEFERQYREVKVAINKLWSEEDGTFYDWHYRKNTLVRIDTVSNFTPMFAGLATQHQAELLMKHAMDPNGYNTLIPFPSVAKKESTYSKDMWRGPVWINMAYLGVKGVDRYGYKKEAAEFARRITKGIYMTRKNSGYFFEFFDPERYDITELTRKKGNLWKQITLGSKPVKNFVGWTGLANTLVIEYGSHW